MKLVRKTGNKAVYCVSSLDVLTDCFFDDFRWLDGTEIAIFCPEKPILDEGRKLAGVSQSHSLWVAYGANVHDISAKACPRSIMNMTISDLPDDSELTRLFIETREDYYRSIKKTMTEWQLKQRDSFIKQQLPSSRRIYIQKNKEAIALLMLTKSKDLQEMPVDWVPWVWISRSISSDERSFIHQHFRVWLGEQVVSVVQCVVSAYNLRSQRFFKNLGFKPECIHLIKPK